MTEHRSGPEPGLACCRPCGLSRGLLLTVATALLAVPASAQTSASLLRPILEAPLVSRDVVAYQLSRHLMDRVPVTPTPSTPGEWTHESRQIREAVLATVLEGWPQEWLQAPLVAEDRGFVEHPGDGYRIRRLRFEVVPGLRVPALLYEPEGVPLPAPAILNVNGHIYGRGKEIEYKQKRCIAQARMGIFALNLDWLYFGELQHPENQHWFGAHLDLAGANGIGLFYLAMRKGLDYLASHPGVDRARIGMTGLSGGGWQTILLSALDERVRAAVPVAGHSSLVSRIEDFGPGDVGDWEQKGTDLLSEFEYTHLTAAISPRPLLQIHNADDIFRSHRVKPGTYDALAPVWELYGRGADFLFHENFDPADHNYELDNRLQAYRFFSDHFGLDPVDSEPVHSGELKTAEELEVGLPADNLTMLAVAKRIAGRIVREEIPSVPERHRAWAEGERRALRETLRYRPVSVARPWFLSGTRMNGLDSRSYRFDFDNGLSATGILLRSVEGGPGERPDTILLHDEGKAAAAAAAAQLVNGGGRVLVADLIFTGDAILPGNRPERNVQMVAALGERPLGLRVAQLLALAKWLGTVPRLETFGMRSQVAGLAAAALAPASFASVSTSGGIPSLRHLLDAPVGHPEAPELFCLGLLQRFDLDRFRALQASRGPAPQTPGQP